MDSTEMTKNIDRVEFMDSTLMIKNSIELKCFWCGWVLTESTRSRKIPRELNTILRQEPERQGYTLSEAWSEVNQADLMAALGLGPIFMTGLPERK